MYNVETDSFFDDNHTFSGDGVRFVLDSSGDYHRETDNGGYDRICDSDGKAVADVHSND